MACAGRFYRKLFVDSRPSSQVFWKVSQWGQYEGKARYIHPLLCYLGAPSHLLWRIRWPLALLMLEVVACMCWGRWRDAWGLSSLDYNKNGRLAYQLSSFALSLLLTVRVSKGYDRFWQARAGVANVRTQAVSLACKARNSLARDPQQRRLADEFARWGVVWCYAIKQTIEYAPRLDAPAAALLSEAELEVATAAAKPRFAAAFKLQHLLGQAARHVSEGELNSMQAAWQEGLKSAGDVARLRMQPGPYTLSLVSTGFLLIWMALLPIVFTSDGDARNDVFLALPYTLFFAVFLLSVDELARQLENPWDLLPYRALVAGAKDDMDAMLREHDAWVRLAAAEEAEEQAGKGAALAVQVEAEVGIPAAASMP